MKYIPIIFVVLLFSCSNNKNEGGIIKTYARSIELIAQEYDISKIDPLRN